MHESDFNNNTIIQMPLCDQKKASGIVRAFYRDVFENNNRKALRRYFSPDAVFGGAIGDLVNSRSELLEAADVLMTAASNVNDVPRYELDRRSRDPSESDRGIA